MKVFEFMCKTSIVLLYASVITSLSHKMSLEAALLYAAGTALVNALIIAFFFKRR